MVTGKPVYRFLSGNPFSERITSYRIYRTSRRHDPGNADADALHCREHRRRSGWTSGGTHGEWSAKGESMSSGVAYGEGCPLSSRLRGLGSVVSSPSGVRGGAPAENAILAYFEGHRTLIFVPI